MKAYFTGSKVFNKEQYNSLLSLGDYVSSSEMPNGGINSLFGSISQQMLLKGAVEYRCIALKNTTGSLATISLGYKQDVKDSFVSYKIAAVAPALNNCNEPYFEKINSTKNKPLTGAFSDAQYGVNNMNFTIGDGDYIGLWIERRINKAISEKLLDCTYLYEQDQLEPVADSFFLEFSTNSVNGTYWLLHTLTQTYAIYYHDTTTGVTSTPTVSSNVEIIIIPMTVGDTITSLYQVTVDKIDALLKKRGEVSATLESGRALITQLQLGAVTAPEAILTSPAFFTNFTQGIGGTQTIENFQLIIDY